MTEGDAYLIATEVSKDLHELTKAATRAPHNTVNVRLSIDKYYEYLRHIGMFIHLYRGCEPYTAKLKGEEE